jgi:hypothetical protein
MGNTVTGLQEKIGRALLQRAAKPGWSDRAQRRLQYFGTELIESRATYNEYAAGVGEFKQQWKEGLYGRDLAGLAICAWIALGGFSLGQMLGRGTFSPLHGMYDSEMTTKTTQLPLLNTPMYMLTELNKQLHHLLRATSLLVCLYQLSSLRHNPLNKRRQLPVHH